MPTYGIIGYPLTHSFSPAFFNEKFRREGLVDYSYKAFPIPDIQQLISLVNEQPDLKGLNVTIPYKREVLHLLQDRQEVVNMVGSCNCISINNGIMTGYNTDVIGFEQSLLPQLSSHHTKALILGTGGSAAAVRYVLAKLGIEYISASRNAGKSDAITYEEITPAIMAACKLIINTTPLGMFPAIMTCPAIPYEYITSQHYLFDLVYNPIKTLFLKKGKDRNAIVKNGSEMLVIQAEESWKIWKEN